MRNICLLCLAFSVAVFAGAARGETIFHYSFDSDYSDSSGNGLDGTPVDGNGDSDTAGVSITTAAGESVFGGGAASFTAERDYVSIPQQLVNSGNEYSLSFWARNLADSGSGGMAMGTPETYGSNFFLWIWDGYVRWRGNSNLAERQADFTYSRDKDWHHYALVIGDYDSGGTVDDVTLYIDGCFVGSDSGNLTGSIYNAIGDGYPSTLDFDWEGQIDEVWMFDTALSCDQVQMLRCSNVIPEPTSVALLLCGLLSLAGLRAARQ